MEFEIKEYECFTTEPQHDMVGSIFNSCRKFNYTFKKGVYFLTGEIDVGSWAFVYSLLGTTKKEWIHYDSITLNGNPTNLSEIMKMSFYVGQHKIYGKKMFEKILLKAIKISKNDCSVDDIFDKFKIVNEHEGMLPTKECAIFQTRIGLWRCTAAIGYAMKKKIFVFPWLSKINFINHIFLDICRILNNEDVIVLVPCSEKIKIPDEEGFKVVRMASLYDVDLENMER
jgi:hypothetical protein